MKLSTIIPWSESFTDEVTIQTFSLAYANKGLAKINIECGLLLPFLENVEENYTALPESWFVELITSYISYGIKMNDASITEAREYRLDFETALMKFRDISRNLVAEEFWDASSPKSYEMDTSNAINIGWFY